MEKDVEQIRQIEIALENLLQSFEECKDTMTLGFNEVHRRLDKLNKEE